MRPGNHIPQTWSETRWAHDRCGGPVYFEIRGGFCYQCGEGPLHPHLPGNPEAKEPGFRYAFDDEPIVTSLWRTPMPHPELHVIGIDPGGTTGWARLTIPRKSMYGDADPQILEWDAGQFYGDEDKQVDSLAQYIRATQGLSYQIGPAVIVEAFRNMTNVDDDAVFSPVRIGAKLVYAQHLGKLDAARIVFQDRSIAKTTMTDDRLKRLGYWLPGEEHARDAMRHAITALRRAKAKRAFRDKIWANP